MAATVQTRLGAINDGVDKKALFLKRFGGEVLTSYHNKRVWTPANHRVKQLTDGKTGQFPEIGTAGAVYHTPGDNLIEDGAYLQNIHLAEALIHADKLLVSPVMVDGVDEILNHYETRSHFANEMGEALAQQQDKQLFQLCALGAAASEIVTGGGGGSVITNAAISHAALTGNNVYDDLLAMSEDMDQKNIPNGDRWAAMRADIFHKLIARVNAPDLILNSDYSPGNADPSKKFVAMIAGFKIVVTENIPRSNIATTVADTGQEYGGNFTKLWGVAWAPRALGTVQWRGVRFSTEFKIEYQADFLTASMLVGHGVLWPAACGAFYHT